jgi:hypothetical protein
MTEDDLQVAALERAVGGSNAVPPPITAPVPAHQPRPVYDAATDGNRFAWILKAAAQVRLQEQAANEVRRIRLQAARRCAMPALVTRGQP